MKPEEKHPKGEAEELNEEELGDVTGGGTGTLQYQPGMDMGSSTLQYQPGMGMGSSTLQYQPGMGMGPSTLQRKSSTLTQQGDTKQKTGGQTHSI